MTVPDGVAHFLEHKLFEKDNDEDLFTAFANDNAQVNAFTSFDRTSYLFSATDRVERNILRLLDMGGNTLFFKRNSRQRKSVAEEIKMYQEQPGYKIMFNTLRAMYHHHPIKVDIAGSVESIYSITKDDLYLCYETFYHPSNMVLFVVGGMWILNVFVMLLKNMKIVVIKQINLLFKEEQ